MKAKDIITLEEINSSDGENNCEICKLHDEAYKKLPDAIICPNCKDEILHYYGDNFLPSLFANMTVVGEYNYYTDDQNIEKCPVTECLKCGKHVALKTIPILYNAGCDVYYTGGNNYLTQDKPGLSEKIASSIEQYTNRIKKGEDLKPVNLMMWIQAELEAIIAKWLCDNGYKY